MKSFLLTITSIVLLLTYSANSYAQAPNIEWQKSFGGTSGDEANCIQQTSDGGYIIAGYSFSNNGDVTNNHGGADYWIIKMDISGTIQWQKLFGGTLDDQASSIQQTNDGGYIVAGYTFSNNGNITSSHGAADCWIVKLDNNGNIQWQKTLGGTSGEFANSVRQTSDGGYIIAGVSKSNDGDVTGNHGSYDYWIIKVDNSGGIQWQKSLGGLFDDEARSIEQTNDGGYIIAGYTQSSNGDVTGNHGGVDSWIIKLDNSGSIQWQRSLGGTNYDAANALQKTNDGGYIIAGYTQSSNGDVTNNHGAADYWIIKLNNAGTIDWQRSFGGTGYDEANAIHQTDDNGYIVAGYTLSNDGDITNNNIGDYWIIKLNNSGVIDWQKCFGGSIQEFPNSIQQTNDKGYIIAGRSLSSDGDVTNNNGDHDYWIVKLFPNNTGITSLEEIIDLGISPVPSKDRLYVTISGTQQNACIKIIDITGKILQTSSFANSGKHSIDISTLSAGIYMLHYSDAKQNIVRTFTVAP